MSLCDPLTDILSIRLSESIYFFYVDLTFIEEMVTSIIKSENIDVKARIALRLAASLVHLESIRSQLLRGRLL